MENVTEIYLVRHGQSVANIENRMAGNFDVELTDLGVMQAKLVANALKDVNACAIYSSDLKRAKNTAKESAKVHNLPVNLCSELREINMGEWEGAKFEDVAKNYTETYNTTWKNDFGFFKSPGGEGVEDVFNRVNEKLLQIAKENFGKKVLVFAHGGVIRIMYGAIKGLIPNGLKDLDWPTNASYSIITFNGEKFSAKEYSVDSFMSENMRSCFKG